MSNQPMSYSAELQLTQLLYIANNMREELRRWNNGGALQHLSPDEISRILNRCEAVMTLMIQEMEYSVDDGK